VVIDKLARKHGISLDKKKHKALIGTGLIEGQKVMLVKPLTYMNLSGESVVSLMRYYDLEPEEIIIIYDDVDIPIGTLRIRKRGSAGTHNGMRSVIYMTQTDELPRFRVGIGGELGNVPLYNYVLSPFEKEQAELIDKSTTAAADAIETLIRHDIDRAMQDFNG
jgi:PTH1 family peptidyl-tRNA hydrolase